MNVRMIEWCGRSLRAFFLVLAAALVVSCKYDAVSGEIVGSASEALAPTVVSVAVTPPTASVPLLVAQQFKATAMYGNGTKKALTSGVAWTPSDPTVATVDSSGLVTPLKPGTVEITATDIASNISDTATLTVTTATLVSLNVTPTKAQIPTGTSKNFTATGTFSDGTKFALDAGAVTWSSSNLAIATVASAGGATGLAEGTVAITATNIASGLSDDALLTVGTATLASVVVTPLTKTLANGLTQAFVAMGTYSDNTTMDLTSIATWASATTGSATISNAPGSAGVATAVGVGKSKISATVAGVKGTATLTVTPAVLTSIAVTPIAANVPNGTTQQLIATGIYSDQTTQDLTTTVTWTSSSPSVSVSNAPGSDGLATAMSLGSATITATDPTTAIAGTATVTVTSAVLVSLAITPPSVTVSLGSARQFTATGTFSDSTTQDVTASVTWSSTQPSVATLSNAVGSAGLATTAGVGTTSVIAYDPGSAQSGSATLTVTPNVLVSIVITPASPAVPLGLTKQLTATGIYSDSSTQDLTHVVTWASSAPAIFSVSNAGPRGLGTALSVGSATITATDPTTMIQGSTIATVTSAVVTTILVSPATVSVMANGGGHVFAAIGIFSDSSEHFITQSVTWTSSSPSATVSNAPGSQGVALAGPPGTAIITATDPTTMVQGTATLTSVGITPLFVPAPNSPIALSGETVAVASADFNGDGYADVATTDVTNNVVDILFGNSLGSLTMNPAGPFAGGAFSASMASTDFNGDGAADLVMADLVGSTAIVLLGDGSGAFAPAPGSPFAFGGGAECVAVGDFNRDGHPDIVIGNAVSTLTVLLGDGSGGFAPAPNSPFATDGGPGSVTTADLDGDGYLDLVNVNSFGGGSVSVLLGDGHGAFVPAAGSPVGVGNVPTSLALADYNGDGHLDAVTATSDTNQVVLLLGDGHGAFVFRSPFAVFAVEPVKVVATDFDGDGHADIATSNYDGTVTVLQGNGAGGFFPAPGTPYAVGQSPFSLAIGDFNGDGRPDLVAASVSSSASVLLNTQSPLSP